MFGSTTAHPNKNLVLFFHAHIRSELIDLSILTFEDQLTRLARHAPADYYCWETVEVFGKT